jgi:hypothetical protein
MPSAVDPYRPELHYMRGPGPKWRAKHGTDCEVRVASGGAWRTIIDDLYKKNAECLRGS